MDTQIIIDVARLDPEGEELSGEAEVVDIDEALVKPFGGVRYRLSAQLFGTELLVKGHLEQDFDLVCSRCGKDFDTTVKVDDFLVSLPIAEGQGEADLTAEVRESIILGLPNFPLCAETCPGIAQAAASVADARWGALDALQVGEKG